MTVAELIAKLQTFPPEQRVLVNDDYLWRHPNPEASKGAPRRRSRRPDRLGATTATASAARAGG